MTELHSVRCDASNVIITRIGESLRFETLKGPYQVIVELPITIVIDPYDRTPLDDQTLAKYHRVTSMITPAKSQQFAALDKETGEFLVRTAQTYARGHYKRERREWPVNVPEVKTDVTPSETVETSPEAPQEPEKVSVAPVIAEQPVVAQEEPVPMISSGHTSTVIPHNIVANTMERKFSQSANLLSGVTSQYGQVQKSSFSVRIPDEIKQVELLQRIAERCAEDVVLITYDIPDEKKDICKNPSKQMWRYGFRTNKSCWLVLKKFVDDEHSWLSKEIRLWMENDVVVDAFRPHPDDTMQLARIAIRELEKEIRACHTSMIKTIDKADKALREGLQTLPPDCTERDVTALNQLRDSAIRAGLKKASEALDRAIICAEQFDATECVDDLIRAFKLARESAVQSFNADAIRRGVKRAS